VVDVYGQALIGVRVSVITQPLYGFTLTRPHRAQYVTFKLLFSTRPNKIGTQRRRIQDGAERGSDSF